ncbi:MAG TPA: MFS transporter [Steroidobacteraceae bacterium]|nr:MFS transporter [Steroidobacteraceae bacterium]
MPARHVFAVALGNAVEFYDFVTYAFFAAQIGRAFFPSDTPGTSLLASLATFGAGFLTRPLGALVLGRLGDRLGRKPAMLASFTLIGVGVIGLPLIPPYASIGILAPLLAIAFRLIQGFALGGEVGPSTAFLMEAAPVFRRGLYISLQAMSADLAVMAAGLVGLSLASVLDPAALDSWGWRVALLAGGVIIPIGLLLRRQLGETLQPGQSPADVPGIRHYGRVAAAGLALLAAATTTNYLLNYMTTYAGSTLGIAPKIAFGATAIVGLCGVVCDPLGGWLSDRFGRKPIMIIPWLCLAVAVFPCFTLLEHARTGLALYIACGVLASASTLSTSASLVAVTESLPHRVRSGALAVIYALAISIFGGSTQFIVAWLTRLTGNPLTPAWYMIGGVIVGLIALRAMPESAPIKIGSAQAQPAHGSAADAPAEVR